MKSVKMSPVTKRSKMKKSSDNKKGTLQKNRIQKMITKKITKVQKKQAQKKVNSKKMSSQKIIYFITGNKDKVNEAQEILTEWNIKQINIDLPELQGTPEEVAYHKTELASKQFKKPFFTDDTALCFDAWNGLPGVYIKHFLKQLGHEGINNALSNFATKKATALACMGYYDGKNIHVVMGSCRGSIVPARSTGQGFGFGWDPIFSPEGHTNQTFATLDPIIKNKISHRKKALEQLKQLLDKEYH